MRKYYITILSILLILALALAALFFSLKTRSVNTENEPKYNIHVITKSYKAEPDFWRIVEQGVRVAETEFDISCYVNGPERESDIDTQISMVEESIAAKPDAIVLAASDYDLLAPLSRKINQAGIVLIIIDSDVNDDSKRSLISTDNYALGQKLANLVDENTDQSRSLAIIGHVEGASTAVDRSEGFMSAITGGYDRVVDIQYCDGSVAIAKDIALDMLEKYPDLECLIGLNETSALGISYALEELGNKVDVLQYSCDSSQEQIQFMESNLIQGFVVQNPFNMGYLSVEAAVNVLDGKKIEPFIDTGSVVITKETMYEPENQKLLFPFNESIPNSKRDQS